MSVIKIDRWYYEGAPPVDHMQCSHCNRDYFILEHQGFLCDCGKNIINHEEYQPATIGEATNAGRINESLSS